MTEYTLLVIIQDILHSFPNSLVQFLCSSYSAKLWPCTVINYICRHTFKSGCMYDWLNIFSHSCLALRAAWELMVPATLSAQNEIYIYIEILSYHSKGQDSVINIRLGGSTLRICFITRCISTAASSRLLPVALPSSSKSLSRWVQKNSGRCGALMFGLIRSHRAWVAFCVIIKTRATSSLHYLLK